MIIYQFHAMSSNQNETKSLKMLATASIGLFGDASTPNQDSYIYQT